jgi:hypothetical protein
MKTKNDTTLENIANFTTIEQWVDYYDDHPEWEGKTKAEMQKDKKTGGREFYKSFYAWAKKESIGKGGEDYVRILDRIIYINDRVN